MKGMIVIIIDKRFFYRTYMNIFYRELKVIIMITGNIITCLLT
jgi:hypothetical protein